MIVFGANATGGLTAIAVDSNGRLFAGGYSYKSYTTAQTAVNIKSGPGILHSISILGGTAGAITVWDSLAGSGNTICGAFTPGNVTVPVTVMLDVSFTVGLTITTAANTVITLAYY